MEALASSGANPRSGLMIRETNDPASRYVLVSSTTSNSGSYHYGSRTATGGTATDTLASGTGSTYTYPNAWIMLQRSGDVVTIATSADDTTWSQIGSVTLTGLTQTVQVGPFSSSGTIGTNARGALTNFALVPMTTVFEAESLAVAAQTEWNHLSDCVRCSLQRRCWHFLRRHGSQSICHARRTQHRRHDL